MQVTCQRQEHVMWADNERADDRSSKDRHDGRMFGAVRPQFFLRGVAMELSQQLQLPERVHDGKPGV